MQNWHSMEVDQVVKELDTDLYKGLSKEEAKRRLEKYGANELKNSLRETKTTSKYKDSSKGIKKEGASFQQFMVRFADIGVTIFLFAVLISTFWQSLFRDPLLAWLRDILESN